MEVNETPEAKHELVLRRTIGAPPTKLFRAWTEPELLQAWFAPKPWSIARAELDVRPGGSSFIVMRSPEGEEFPSRGVYLEVEPNHKLVFTDAYTAAWVPSERPFFTGIVTFEPLEDGTTRYTARARHWNAEDRAEHERMGFYEGWGKCADQLGELVQRL